MASPCPGKTIGKPGALRFATWDSIGTRHEPLAVRGRQGPDPRVEISRHRTSSGLSIIGLRVNSVDRDAGICDDKLPLRMSKRKRQRAK
jgi:hypothetical protein